jgi:copper chaperone CopZ
MIVSFIPGRIRLRFTELKNQELCDQVRARVKEIPGIITVETKALTGSILIEYDEKILPTEKLVSIGREELAKVNIILELPEGARAESTT